MTSSLCHVILSSIPIKNAAGKPYRVGIFLGHWIANQQGPSFEVYSPSVANPTPKSQVQCQINRAEDIVSKGLSHTHMTSSLCHVILSLSLSLSQESTMQQAAVLIWYGYYQCPIKPISRVHPLKIIFQLWQIFLQRVRFSVKLMGPKTL